MVSVFLEGFDFTLFTFYASLPQVILQQLIQLPGIEKLNSVRTEDRIVSCRSGGVSRYLGRFTRECWEGAWPQLAWKLTSPGERCNRGRTRFSVQEDKRLSDLFPVMSLLSPARKCKVRQTRFSLSSWECGVGGKCSDLLSCRNMEQRELVWREKTSS